MFKRRDIPPVLLLLLLIILVMLTLSQILVVHNGRYGHNVHNMRKLQLELREMDINLHSLMMQNVPSIELNRRLLQNEINAGRIAAIIAQASRTQHTLLSNRGRKTKKAIARRMMSQAKGSEVAEARVPLSSPRDIPDDSRTYNSQPVNETMKQPLEILKSNLSLENNTIKSSNMSPNQGQQQQQRGRSISIDNILLSSSYQNSSVQISSEQQNSSSAIASQHESSSLFINHTSHHIMPVTLSTFNTSVFTHHTSDGRGTSRLTSDINLRLSGLSTTGSHLQLPAHQKGVKGHSTLDGEYGMVSRTSLSDNNNYNMNKNSQILGGKYGVIHIDRARGKKEVINYCPSIPPNLKGRVFVNFEHRHNFTESEIVRQNSHIQPGGMWRPTACVARHRVAIIVPYRDRWQHLMILLSHLHPILERQQLDYRIFVVEQAGKDTFNKARIMNIAFVEALKQNNFQCFVFHDVDLVPEDDRNMYSCPTQPRHMSVAIDEMGYKLAYQELVGGVLNMRTEHFQRVNGYSNLYWGWGAEDDDMAYRIMHVGLKITRPPEGVARYKMVKHTKRKPADWRKRAKLLYTGTRRFQFDGLNSLQYRVVHIKKLPLFSHILVDIGKPPRGF